MACGRSKKSKKRRQQREQPAAQQQPRPQPTEQQQPAASPQRPVYASPVEQKVPHAPPRQQEGEQRPVRVVPLPQFRSRGQSHEKMAEQPCAACKRLPGQGCIPGPGYNHVLNGKEAESLRSRFEGEGKMAEYAVQDLLSYYRPPLWEELVEGQQNWVRQNPDVEMELNAARAYAVSRKKQRPSNFGAWVTLVRWRKEVKAKPPSLSLAKKSYSQEDVQNAWQDAYSTKSAICTTFAMAAAAQLTGDQERHQSGADRLRVEVASIKARGAGHAGTHVFAIIGRPLDSDLNDLRSWVNSAYVVDVWAAALNPGLPSIQLANKWIPYFMQPKCQHGSGISRIVREGEPVPTCRVCGAEMQAERQVTESSWKYVCWYNKCASLTPKERDEYVSHRCDQCLDAKGAPMFRYDPLLSHYDNALPDP